MRIELPCSSNPSVVGRDPRGGRVHDPAVCEWVMAAMGLNSVTDWAVTHYVGGRRANPKVERRVEGGGRTTSWLLFVIHHLCADGGVIWVIFTGRSWREGIGFRLARILSVTLNMKMHICRKVL